MMKKQKSSKYLTAPTRPVQIDRDRSVAGVLQKMEGAGFQARALAESHNLWLEMLEDNSTDVELVVRGNTVRRGDLVLRRNGGPSAKTVQGNTGRARLLCSGNAAPFAAVANTGWATALGQCA